MSTFLFEKTATIETNYNQKWKPWMRLSCTESIKDNFPQQTRLTFKSQNLDNNYQSSLYSRDWSGRSVGRSRVWARGHFRNVRGFSYSECLARVSDYIRTECQRQKTQNSTQIMRSSLGETWLVIIIIIIRVMRIPVSTHATAPAATSGFATMTGGY